MRSVTDVKRNQNLEHCGFRELMQLSVWKACLILFMGLIHKADVDMNRKVLADLAMNHPEAFKAVVAKAKEFAK